MVPTSKFLSYGSWSRRLLKLSNQVKTPLPVTLLLAPTAAAASTVNQDPPSQDDANNVAASTADAALTFNKDPPSQDDANNVAAPNSAAAASTVNEDLPQFKTTPIPSLLLLLLRL